jgi:hypothetical protein
MSTKLSKEEEREIEIEEKSVSEKRQNLIAFFLLGLLNNCTYVLLNAGAGDIVPGKRVTIRKRTHSRMHTHMHTIQVNMR